MACCDSTLGLLGIIAHAEVEIKAERGLFANQETFDEADVLRADLFKEIFANYWVRIPSIEELHVY